MKAHADLYPELPGIDELLREPEVAALIAHEGQAATTDACRAVLARLRDEIAAGHLDSDKLRIAIAGIHDAIRNELGRALGYSLLPVINATGVILHTNLGRAPLAASAMDHIRETAEAYSNLEFNLDSGERGKRDVHVDRLFRKLLSQESVGTGSTGRAGVRAPTRSEETGATGVPARLPLVSTIVVNNNAAAVLLALNTLAEGGEVIVSRGELVEIGGSFRIPDVMAKSGATLHEVGTTNRTRIADYERAVNERTKLLLRVHRSNFEITGFTEQPDLSELVALAAKHKLPLMEDLGSGALFDLRTIGINSEPSVLDSVRCGVHVVTYSGDKLLGGPQAGLISGREDLVQKMRSNSLFRAFRVDKLTYAALEATLLAYIKRDHNGVPALRMMQLSKSEITKRAETLISQINSAKIVADLIDGESLIGGGSAPSAVLPTTLIALTRTSLSANELATRLRTFNPPVIARVEEGRILLDLRTVFPAQDEVLRQILAQIAP
ncbi:MAG: L-seryl-tRNA selenium transferase [Acidobacteriaceae bacterium]|nr:L-seryl-tRNA selenium transferase [Acidobacteriaceae bacterium]